MAIVSKLFVIDPGEGSSSNGPPVARFSDFDKALLAVESESNEEVLLCTQQILALLQPGNLRPSEAERCDLLHSGLKLGSKGSFRLNMLTSTSWFWLDAPVEHSSTNWRATPNLCFLRPEVVRALGGFDWAYCSPSARLMDLAWRLLSAGGRVRFHAGWLPSTITPPDRCPAVPLTDEFLFILRANRNGVALARYAAFWAIFALRIAPFQVLRALHHASILAKEQGPPKQRTQAELCAVFRLLASERRQQVDPRDISVIIPTINRYEYIGKSIESILSANQKPVEIIVVDQTPLEQRRAAVYEPYLDQQVRVLFLEEAGQSVARNTGVNMARGEWLLLFEDDAVAWDEMIERHLYVIEHSGAAGSTGVSLAPWKTRENIPPAIRHWHTANVLATGNCLISKAALVAVNGLDRCFDHGSGADNDLGLRLYMAGYEVIFNHEAIETHYKAPSGGMRTYGAWWRSRVSGLRPFPAPTYVYTIQKYYPRFTHLAHFVQAYFLARRYGWRYWLGLTVTLPWRFPRALYRAGQLAQRGGLPRYHEAK